MASKKRAAKAETRTSRRPKLPAFVVPTDEEILAATPRALELIASSNRPTWQTIVSMMQRAKACSPELASALISIDDFSGWERRIFQAFNGLNPDDGLEADWLFRRWFAAGVARHLAASDQRALQFRFANALRDVESDSSERVRELARAIETSVSADIGNRVLKELLGQTILLLALRVGEDGNQDEQLMQTARAEGIFEELGARHWVAQSRRARAGALLGLRRIDEALEILESVWEIPRPDLIVSYSLRSGPRSDAISDLLKTAAQVAWWAPKTATQWLESVKNIGEKLDHKGCLDWYEKHRHHPADVTTNYVESPDIWELFEQQGRIV